MRLFLAIQFDETTKKSMLTVQGRLREYGRGNFSRPENLHLTLHFLGEVEESQVSMVNDAMDSVLVPCMKLRFSHMGSFQRQGGNLWWLGIEPNPALIRLQKSLGDQLHQRGFPVEQRRYSPHITLARQLVMQEKPDYEALLGTPFHTEAYSISLMRSERVRGVLTYTEQYRVSAKE